MRHVAALLVVGVLFGCTEPNPGYQPTPTTPDGTPPECQPSERQCSGRITQVCSGAGSWLNERLCPEDSSCKAGVCVPSGERCASEASCGVGRACSVFVDPANSSALATFCINTVGLKAGTMPCTGDEQCRSGFCLQRGPLSICFRACQERSDCTGKDQRCQTVYLTVNGVQGGVKSCVPGGGSTP
jgi:hypothetical protein